MVQLLYNTLISVDLDQYEIVCAKFAISDQGGIAA